MIAGLSEWAQLAGIFSMDKGLSLLRLPLAAFLFFAVAGFSKEPSKETTGKVTPISAQITLANTSTTVDTAGNRVYLLTLRTIQYGGQFFGTMRLSCEVTDQHGTRFYGSANAKQQNGFNKITTYEWEFEIKTEGISVASLTGYSAAYTAPDISRPLVERSFGCQNGATLKARNEKSKPLNVRSKLVRLVDGQN